MTGSFGPQEPTPDAPTADGTTAYGTSAPHLPPYGWAGPGAGPWGEPPRPAGRIRRHRTRPLVAGALVAGTVAASAGLGHVLWPGAASTASASAPTGSASSGSAGSSSAGSAGGSATAPGSLGGGTLGGGSVFGGSPYGGYGSGAGASAGSSAGATQGAGAPSNVAGIAAGVDPGLVDVNTSFGYQQASGAGTGIVLTSDGEILTNNHVINGATSISVTDIGNGRTYPARVVGYDASADVAVLQLQGASGLQTAKIGNSSSVKVGQPVVAVGNAGGAGGTPSAAGGSVTALNQSITAGDELNGESENLTGLIQVDAGIQPGDSGGPLVDTGGRVIGVDSAASTGYSLQSDSSQGIQGYAIPINRALSIARQIEAGQATSTVHVGPTAFLGVLVSSGGTGSGGSPFGGSPFGGSGFGGSGATATGGADVADVVPGGAAARAGITSGDVITALDGSAVSTPSELSRLMAPEKPGQSISITWTDSAGQSHTATVTLTAGPPA